MEYICKYCGKPISYSRRKRIYCNGFCAHNDPDVQRKIKNTFDKNFRQNPNNMNNLKNRIKNTQMEKYGGIGFQSSILMEKVKDTNIKKYGVENVFSSKKIQQKIKETNIKKYGVEYPIQCENIKKKCKENNLKKFDLVVGTMNNFYVNDNENIELCDDGFDKFFEGLFPKTSNITMK